MDHPTGIVTATGNAKAEAHATVGKPNGSKVVVGYIDPIPADALVNLDKMGLVGGGDVVHDANTGESRMTVPIEADIHIPQLASMSPIIVKQPTLEHARKVADDIASRLLPTLPHTAEAANLIAMAFAVLHYDGQAKRDAEKIAELEEKLIDAKHDNQFAAEKAETKEH